MRPRRRAHRAPKGPRSGGNRRCLLPPGAWRGAQPIGDVAASSGRAQLPPVGRPGAVRVVHQLPDLWRDHGLGQRSQEANRSQPPSLQLWPQLWPQLRAQLRRLVWSRAGQAHDSPECALAPRLIASIMVFSFGLAATWAKPARGTSHIASRGCAGGCRERTPPAGVPVPRAAGQASRRVPAPVPAVPARQPSRRRHRRKPPSAIRPRPMSGLTHPFIRNMGADMAMQASGR